MGTSLAHDRQQLQPLRGDAGARPALLDAHKPQLLQLGSHGADVLLAEGKARRSSKNR